MKNWEAITDFLSKAVAVVSKIRSCGEKVTDQTILEKILQSMTIKFNYVVAFIEESKDLTVFSFDQLTRSLQAHEVKEATTKYGENNGPVSRNRRRRGFCSGLCHGYGRDRGRNEQSNRKNDIQCNHCQHYGHIKASCWYKDQKINFAATENEKQNYLFMACIDTHHKSGYVWFVYSGCSNHTSGTKSLFQELDEKKKKKVQLGNTKEMQVKGKCIFDDDACVIRNKKSGKTVFITMTQNKMFPMDISNMECFALASSGKDESKLWYLRKHIRNIQELQNPGCEAKCIKKICTDRGAKFSSKEFNLFREENYLQRELTTPYTPEQNGVAERKNRIVVDTA
ncbi:uncharacterized protein LOC107009816 [Solanum pennellii]|uniref:Uncharacterized protein LOC107009816 n=1 Tax=Solanum pennellii TaxID=28526 RepID=A0ABM1G1J5_SOLPN|nr:uncharacterized protein LOC107009816 [Solanum pennellii]